ncbi:hypothetical protein INS49_005904 [Diaporthe citri]|uniref:uncharacterized protein n=1 Tax=Diaporthe citri TaxID=83186 RepID=UPI001C801C1F|nr:uncharacterized protein INS49_005904 [Diaporthe citri]KAG6364304.1 hypothetical protein INS49_005904 [Diaporthe citri]
MAPGNPNREPTLFEVLSISPRSLDGQDQASQAKIARQAYRRALLKHHPDRQAQKTDENAAATSDSSSASNEQSSQHFTVDQITEAYTILSDAKKRREYTRTLRSQTKTTSSSSAHTKTKRRQKSRSSGVDTVVLDDDMKWDGKRRLYYRACDGCGKARGFSLREDEIEEDSEEDFEMILECAGCEQSLSILVPALADEDDGTQLAGQGASGLQAQQPQANDPASQRSHRDPSPPKKSRGWGFRLGLGLSLGGGWVGVMGSAPKGLQAG